MNTYPIGNDLTVKWSLLYSDGSVFPLYNYDYEFSYRTNRGNKVVTDTSVISVDENILTWTFKGDEQVVSGRYTICLKITLSGSKVVELQYDNAFMLSPLSGFKGAGSEIVLQSYCDAIDLKDAVLQARKAMDVAQDAKNIAGSAVNTAAGAVTTANDAKTIASTANNTSTEAKTIANNAKTVADQAKVTADATAATATQKAEEVAQKEAQLEAALNNLSTDQSGALALSTKVNEHGEKLSELIIQIKGFDTSLTSMIVTAGGIDSVGADKDSYTVVQYCSRSGFIPVRKGYVIDFKANVPTSCVVLAFYTSDSIDTFVEGIQGTGGDIVGSYEVPNDGYIRISTLTTKAQSKDNYFSASVVGMIAPLEDRITDVENGVASINNQLSDIDGKFDGLLAHVTISKSSGRVNQKLYVGHPGEDVAINISIASGSDESSYTIYGTNADGTADYNTILANKTPLGETSIVNVPASGYLWLFTQTSMSGERTYDVLVTNLTSVAGKFILAYKRMDGIDEDIAAVNAKIPYTLNPMPKKIVCFGDSILGNDGETIAALRQLTGADIHNCAVGGTSVSNRNYPTDHYYPFDGENLITAVTTNDFTSQEANVSYLASAIRARLTDLEQMDWSSVDLIVLAWGTNDYTQGKTIEEITTAMGRCFDMLQSTFPLIRILVLTNTWRFWKDIDSDSKVFNVSTGKEIANAIESFCKDRRINVLNSYQEMPVSMKNATTYFDNVTTDGDADQQSGVEVPLGSGQYYSGVHFNLAGNNMYAHIIEGKIRSIF